jgi:archaellum component FlaC
MSIQSIYTKLNKFSSAQGRKVQDRENTRFANKWAFSSVSELEEAYADLQVGANEGAELLGQLEEFVDQFENEMKRAGERFNAMYDMMMEYRSSAQVVLMDFNDAAFELGLNPDDVPQYKALKSESEKMDNLRNDVEDQMRIARQYINF